MPVAKSYQDLEQLCEPFEENRKKYILVKTKKGVEKKVRFYSNKEYLKMYPEEKNKDGKKIREYGPQKDVLGFIDGYITIFKGDTEKHKKLLKSIGCTKTRSWGWGLKSTLTLPENFPKELVPIKLNWKDVGEENGYLKDNEKEIIDFVEKLKK